MTQHDINLVQALLWQSNVNVCFLFYEDFHK